MAEPYYKSKEFLALRWEWYDKLKKDGKFTDIEFYSYDTGESLPTMNGMSSVDMKKSGSRWGNSKIEYYRLAEQHKLRMGYRYAKSAWEYQAWAMHADGVGTKAIARALGVKASAVVKLVAKEARFSMRGGHQ